MFRSQVPAIPVHPPARRHDLARTEQVERECWRQKGSSRNIITLLSWAAPGSFWQRRGLGVRDPGRRRETIPRTRLQSILDRGVRKGRQLGGECRENTMPRLAFRVPGPRRRRDSSPYNKFTVDPALHRPLIEVFAWADIVTTVLGMIVEARSKFIWRSNTAHQFGK